MFRVFVWMLTIVCASAQAEEVDIWKVKNQIPRVSCKFADIVTAGELFKLLEEPFIVADSEKGGCEKDEVVLAPASEPVVGVPGGSGPTGPIGPIGPRCQCPEDYVNNLEPRYATLLKDVRTRSVLREQAVTKEKTAITKSDLVKELNASQLDQQTKQLQKQGL